MNDIQHCLNVAARNSVLQMSAKGEKVWLKRRFVYRKQLRLTVRRRDYETERQAKHIAPLLKCMFQLKPPIFGCPAPPQPAFGADVSGVINITLEK
jgi:hypothetical protein